MLKILVVGCGAISRHWFEYTLQRKDCDIVGVVDINPENAKFAVKAYGLFCPVFTDLDQALAETKPDVVYDLSYVTTHKDVSVKCMLAGCSVFSEKPMTIDRESANLLLETAKKCNVSYFIMQNRRYQKAMWALKEVIPKLGKISTICADIFVGEDLASIRNQLQYPMLQDNAIHTFDGVRFVTGADASSVYCHSYNLPEPKYKGDSAGICIFEMSNGSVFIYNCIMGTHVCNTSWESSWRIVGSKGTVMWDGFNAPYAELIHNENGAERIEKITLDTTWNGKNQHHGCLEEMFEAYLKGEKSATDGTDNIKSMAMVFAALESVKTGQKVKVQA